MRFPMDLSMTVSNNAAFWAYILCCIAHSRNAAPVAETLKFCSLALRSNSARTLCLRCKVVCLVGREYEGLFRERGTGFIPCCCSGGAGR